MRLQKCELLPEAMTLVHLGHLEFPESPGKFRWLENGERIMHFAGYDASKLTTKLATALVCSQATYEGRPICGRCNEPASEYSRSLVTPEVTVNGKSRQFTLVSLGLIRLKVKYKILAVGALTMNRSYTSVLELNMFVYSS